VRYSRSEIRAKVFQSLCSQFSRGGLDTEFHGFEWRVGWKRIGASAAFWLGLLVLFLWMVSDDLGMPVVFVVVTVAVAGFAFTVMSMGRTAKVEWKRAPRSSEVSAAEERDAESLRRRDSGRP
jgi:hypothetical protein